MTGKAFIPSSQEWMRQGFIPATPVVCRRHRHEGLLDVVIRNTDGSYWLWVAQASSIWLLLTEAIRLPPLQDRDAFEHLLAQFPAEPLHHVPYADFATPTICSIT